MQTAYIKSHKTLWTIKLETKTVYGEMLFIKISLLLITSMYLSAGQNPYINHIPKSDGLSPTSKNNLTLK